MNLTVIMKMNGIDPQAFFSQFGADWEDMRLEVRVPDHNGKMAPAVVTFRAKKSPYGSRIENLRLSMKETLRESTGEMDRSEGGEEALADGEGNGGGPVPGESHDQPDEGAA